MGCQSGSGSSCPAPGATPFAPGAPLPSTADRPDRNGLEWRVRMAFTSQAEQQAEQQGAERQCDAQRFEAVQFGIRMHACLIGFAHEGCSGFERGAIEMAYEAMVLSRIGHKGGSTCRF